MAREKIKAPVTKKKQQVRKEKSATQKQQKPAASLDLQQKCLSIFRDALKPGDEDTKVLQEVKGHLFNREFAQAFGKEEYLRVYASRWSPSRALGYLQVFADIRDEILKEQGQEPSTLKVICIGGGAGAELVAIAAWRNEESGNLASVDATYLDIAAWGSVITCLHEAVTMPRQLSKYASASAKEANVAWISAEACKASFHKIDALEMSPEESRQLFSSADLVTLMFTLNELYSTSMSKTQQLLTRITSTSRPGSHLLVVDSPGSYSTVAINGAEKKYPMQWLLDFTLLGPEEERSEAKWEKLVSDDSRWFRLPPGLQYPIELENMRYQIHLYRRLPDAG